MSLRWRWALTLAGVAVVAVTVVGVGAGALIARSLRADVDRGLERRAQTLERVDPGDFASRFPRSPGRIDLLRPLVGPEIEVQALDRLGEVAFTFEDGPLLPVDDADRRIAAEGAGSSTRTVTVDGTDYRVLTAPLRSGAIQLARDLTPLAALLGVLTRRLLVVGALAAVATALVGWWLAGRALRPMEDLTRAAEQIARTQDLAVPVPSGGPDEVGRLSTSFATMISALDESRRQQQQLVSDAGHELRTPLTGLRTNVEVLARRADLSPEERDELVQAALAEVGELGDLVTELVDLATDAGLSLEAPVTQGLHDFAAPVVNRHQRLLGRPVQLVGAGGEVTFRPTQFERALGNLIDNAAKWSRPDDPIEVVVADRSIQVRDRGPGIPPADAERVFDRFYRGPGAGAKPGSGLGLAIVKQAVEAHGGTVFAHNHPEGGAVVGFTLGKRGQDVPSP